MTIRTISAMAALAAAIVSTPAAAVVIAPGPQPVAATICAPMICTLRYQQAISAAFFTGPITISSLTFGNTFIPGSMPADNSFSITLSTARRGVGTLSTDFTANAGLDAAAFFNGSYQGSTRPGFTIQGSSFVYDPRLGDLLIDIRRNTPAANVTDLYLDASQGNFTGPVGGVGSDFVFTYNADFFIGVQRASGLILGINEGAGTPPGGGSDPGPPTTGAVPEPETWALLFAGFFGIGHVLRRRPARTRIRFA